jgi:hypothetical protein
MARSVANPEQRVPASAAVHVSVDSSDPEYETWTFVVYDVARLPDVQSAWIATGILTRGSRGFVATVMAARPGFGPLLYTLAATYSGVTVFPSDDRSADALRFWRRQWDTCVYPMTDAAFSLRFGKDIARMEREDKATKTQIATMVNIGVHKANGPKDEVKSNPGRVAPAHVPVVTAITTAPGGRLAYVFETTPTRRNPDERPVKVAKAPIPRLPEELEAVKIAVLTPLSATRPTHFSLRKYQNWNREDYAELAQEAYIGALVAANAYAQALAAGEAPMSAKDFKKRLDFAAQSAVSRYVTRIGTIRPDKAALEARKMYTEMKKATAEKLGIQPERVTVRDIAKFKGMTLEAVEALRTAAGGGQVVSFEAPIASDAEGNDQTLSDTLADVATGERGEMRAREADLERIEESAGDDLNAIDQEFRAWKKKGYTVMQIAAKLGMGRTTAYATNRRILRILKALADAAASAKVPAKGRK